MSDWYLPFCNPADLSAVRETMGPFGFSLTSVAGREGLAAGSVYVWGEDGSLWSLPITALSAAMEGARISGMALAQAVLDLARVLAAYR